MAKQTTKKAAPKKAAPKKRFTFADAKAKIKQLEQELQDTRDAFITELERAEADVRNDWKSVGFGDVGFIIAGAVVGFILGAIFI